MPSKLKTWIRRNAVEVVVWGLMALFLVLTVRPAFGAHRPVNHPIREAVAATVHKFHDPVLGISCSAVMVAPERAITAAHCLNMTAPVLTIDGYEYAVTEGYAASPRDVAILIVPGAPCPCARVADVAAVEGDPVAVVGYPFGLSRVVTYGEFQGRVVLAEDGQEYLLITALGAPGNSGGGVFDNNGDLIGITSKGAQGIFLLAVELFTMPIVLQ